MSSSDQEDKVFNELLAEMGEDVVGLWTLFTAVERARLLGDDQGLGRVLALVERVLKRGAFAVEYREGRFVRWSETPDEVVARVRREWLSLGRPPGLGDIVWFTTIPPEQLASGPSGGASVDGASTGGLRRPSPRCPRK